MKWARCRKISTTWSHSCVDYKTASPHRGLEAGCWGSGREGQQRLVIWVLTAQPEQEGPYLSWHCGLVIDDSNISKELKQMTPSVFTMQTLQVCEEMCLIWFKYYTVCVTQSITQFSVDTYNCMCPLMQIWFRRIHPSSESATWRSFDHAPRCEIQPWFSEAVLSPDLSVPPSRFSNFYLFPGSVLVFPVC